jgi:outer membrane protein TolC
MTSALWAQEPHPDEKVATAQDPEALIPVDHEGEPLFPLSLEDALRLGYQNNSALRVQELVPFQVSEDVRGARSIFEPELFADATAAHSESPLQVFQPAGFAQPAVTQDIYNGRFGVRQLVPSGGLFDLSFSPSKLHQSSSAGIVEQLGSDFTATYTQPLLRGAWSDYTLQEVHIAEALHAGAELRYQRAVQDTLQLIVVAYWEFVFARKNYLVARAALDLAQEQLDRTNRKIEVGEVAPLDRVADEAEVARRREELVTAETAIRSREDAVRRLVFGSGDGRLWARNLQPTTPIGEFPPSNELPWERFAEVARRLRPDLRALRSDVAVAQIQLEAAERDVLPGLDLISSFSSDGIATNFPDAFDQTTDGDFPDWSVSLQFSLPIGNNGARALRDRSRLELERTQRLLYSAMDDVDLEVREAVRQLRALAESIQRGKESVRLAETNLNREIARKDAGTSTTFEVQQRNQELQEARQRLLRNELDYRIAESRLLYVQGLLEVPAPSSGTPVPPDETGK